MLLSLGGSVNYPTYTVSIVTHTAEEGHTGCGSVGGRYGTIRAYH